MRKGEKGRFTSDLRFTRPGSFVCRYGAEIAVRHSRVGGARFEYPGRGGAGATAGHRVRVVAGRTEEGSS